MTDKIQDEKKKSKIPWLTIEEQKAQRAKLKLAGKKKNNG